MLTGVVLSCTVLLSSPDDRSSFCLDALLLFRAGSVHMAPCLLIEALPALDLLEAEGIQIPEGSAGDIIWAPLWCAEALSKRRFADIMLPPFLRRGRSEGNLR